LPPSTKRAKFDPFSELRDDSSRHQDATKDVTSLSTETELAKYKSLAVKPGCKGSIQFWKEQASEFPIMSQVARRVLCITASSAQCERVFSSVGNTITHVRSRLSAEKGESVEIVRWGLKNGLC